MKERNESLVKKIKERKIKFINLMSKFPYAKAKRPIHTTISMQFSIQSQDILLPYPKTPFVKPKQNQTQAKSNFLSCLKRKQN